MATNCVSVHETYIALEPSLDGEEPTAFKAVVLSPVPGLFHAYNDFVEAFEGGFEILNDFLSQNIGIREILGSPHRFSETLHRDQLQTEPKKDFGIGYFGFLLPNQRLVAEKLVVPPSFLGAVLSEL